MRHFSHLKTITIFHEQNPELFIYGGPCHDTKCDSVKFLNVYASQMLSNVENLKISSFVDDWNFIKFAPKLRYMELMSKYAMCEESINADHAVMFMIGAANRPEACQNVYFQ